MDNEEIAYRPGEVLAEKYKVDRVIGMGGFGAVLAATHLELDRVVALKVLLPHAAKNAAAAERFVREARAAAKLKSEHVAEVRAVGKLPDGTPYMEMEYLEGEDLSAIVKNHGGQSVHDVAEWVLQACEALAEAHKHGIVHRDLKPANLFLTRKVDGAPCVKVLDFGISKMSNEIGDKGMTKTSDVMGSPFYMSPEQMRSTRSVDARSDIWALGAIVYEMLAGYPPFDADTMTALVVSIMQEPPRDLGAFRRDIPAAVRQVIDRCLQKDPNQRYQDVAALTEALAPFAPARAMTNVHRVMAISGRTSHPNPVSSGPAAAPVAPTAPGANTLAGAPASVAFRGSNPPPGAATYASQQPRHHSQPLHHAPEAAHAVSYAQGYDSGSHAPVPPAPTQPGSFAGPAAALTGNPAHLASSGPSPAQSWGGTYMGKKQGGSKTALVVGLIALTIALVGGGGGAYYLVTKQPPKKAARSSSDDVTAAHTSRAGAAEVTTEATAEASASAEPAPTATAEPTATQEPVVEPVATAPTGNTTRTGTPKPVKPSDPPPPPKPEPAPSPIITVVTPPPPPPPKPEPTPTQKPKPPEDPLFGRPD